MLCYVFIKSDTRDEKFVEQALSSGKHRISILPTRNVNCRFGEDGGGGEVAVTFLGCDTWKNSIFLLKILDFLETS